MTSSAPPPPTAPDPLLGRVLDNRYRIEAFVARGGMATVYRGVDQRLHRTVAVKVMHPIYAPDQGFVERFEREARAAARLSNQHVVAVHDQGSDAGIVYLVMEYVPGHTVRDVLRSHGALPPAQALAIIDPVLQALAAAHRAGYIHRDVKPENVLISDDGRVKVTDFGLARAIEGADHGMSQGLLLGTVAYLSPEQVEHDRTDARSDVYGAGILLFELVTGQVPYSASAPMQVALKHMHEDVPPPSSVRPDIPPDVDEIVERATRRDPEARYPDADAFLHAVRALRARLPEANPWAPAPHDTLVVRPAAAAAAPAAAASATPAGGSDADATVVAAPLGAAAGPAGPSAAGPPPAASSPTMVGPLVATAGPLGPPLPGSATSAEAAPAARAPRRRPRRGRWLLALSLVSVIGLIVLVLGPLRPVSVPDVLGMTPTEAGALLATSNLRLESDQTAYSEEVSKGRIISTDPGPDGVTRSGGTVRAIVSLGPERYDVPKLSGMTVDDARAALEEVKLELGEQAEVWDEEIAEGRVVSSDPPAGRTVKPGTVVSIEVSKGPEPIVLPQLVGTDGDTAQRALKDLGLKVTRSDRTSESVPAGAVISMEPASGTTLYRGDAVALVVSTGPPLVQVPNVVGRTEAQARSALQGAGFKVDVNYPLRVKVLDRVRTQSPRGNQSAPRGSTVQIDVV